MPHNDDAFATMLLMSRIAADRDEIARPLSAAEYYRLEGDVRRAGLNGLGELIGADVSYVRNTLDLSEPEAYRLCVLLNRAMPLSYALERFSEGSIDITTVGEINYPAQLVEKLGEKAPPMLYSCGDMRIASQPAIALIGSGGRSSAEGIVRALAERAAQVGLMVVTGDEPGVGRMAERLTALSGGQYLAFMAGGLSDRVYQPGISEMIASRRALALSAVHPDAKYTVSHALDRNKCLYSLCCAAIVISAGPEKGAAFEGACSAMRNNRVERVYAWDSASQPGNRRLIAHGATGFVSPDEIPLDELKRRARTPKYEQLSIF